MTSLVPVPVPGANADLQAADFGGTALVAFRPLCDSLGVDPDGQAKKLRGRSWATTVLKTVVAADGRAREMLMVDRRTLAMWLATLDERRVNIEARDRVIAFQAEAADALDAYFNARLVTAPSVNQFDVLRAAIDQIEAAQREASAALALAQRTEARLDGIEGRHDWFSALGYAKTKGLPTYAKFLARVGKHAAMIARSHGIEPDKTQHPHYGSVNSFPVWVWDLAAEGFSA